MRTERQARALLAARAIAARHGLRSAGPRLLSDCNNTIVCLDPWSVVAKVADTSHRPAAAARLRRELDVALYLARAGAPVGEPSLELPVRAHRHGSLVVTFWRYHTHDPGASIDPDAASRALHEVHRALESYPGRLPSFPLLPDPRRLCGDDAERESLLAEYAWLAAALEGRAWRRRPLHGDPHGGNFLSTRTGCLWIDFESACLGPQEWDLSALPGGDLGSRPDVDCELLAVLRRVRTLRTVAWCRTRAGSWPEVERAAAAHIALVRAA